MRGSITGHVAAAEAAKYIKGAVVMVSGFRCRVSNLNVVIGGPVSDSSGFPIGAFGNDRLLEVRQ